LNLLLCSVTENGKLAHIKKASMPVNMNLLHLEKYRGNGENKPAPTYPLSLQKFSVPQTIFNEGAK